MISINEVMDEHTEKVYSFDEMIDMYDDIEEKYIRISNRLICPSCKTKSIIININDDYASIKTKRNNHEAYCDYYGYKISQEEIKKRIKNKVSFKGELSNFDNSKNIKMMPKKILKES